MLYYTAAEGFKEEAMLDGIHAKLRDLAEGGYQYICANG